MLRATMPSSPREYRLLQIGDAGDAAEHQFAELIEKCSGGCMHSAAVNVDSHDAPFALGDAHEVDGVIARDVAKRDAMYRSHLLRIDRQGRAHSRPHDDRSDEIARTGRIVVEEAKHRAGVEVQTNFLAQLSQCGLRLGLATIAPPA